MKPVSYSSYSAWSKVFMPRRVERDITSLILATSPLKIRSWMSGELSMISIAAMRPEPASRGTSRCEMSALMLSDRSISSWSRRSSGKKLTTRSSAWLALLACSVASTRCPVSENWMPYSMVSRSRVEHDLHRRDAPGARLARHQPLRDERPDVERQIHQQLVAPLVGEEVDDAVERLVGAVGVQRRQHQVSGLGELDAVLHGLPIAS